MSLCRILRVELYVKYHTIGWAIVDWLSCTVQLHQMCASDPSVSCHWEMLYSQGVKKQERSTTFCCITQFTHKHQRVVDDARSKRFQMWLWKRRIEHLSKSLPLVSVYRENRGWPSYRGQFPVCFQRFWKIIDSLDFIRNSLVWISTPESKSITTEDHARGFKYWPHIKTTFSWVSAEHYKHTPSRPNRWINLLNVSGESPSFIMKSWIDLIWPHIKEWGGPGYPSVCSFWYDTSLLKRRRWKINHKHERPISRIITSPERSVTYGNLFFKSRPREAAVNSVQFIPNNYPLRSWRVRQRWTFHRYRIARGPSIISGGVHCEIAHAIRLINGDGG